MEELLGAGMKSWPRGPRDYRDIDISIDLDLAVSLSTWWASSNAERLPWRLGLLHVAFCFLVHYLLA